MEYIFSDKLSALKPSAIREIFKSLTDPTIISFAFFCLFYLIFRQIPVVSVSFRRCGACPRGMPCAVGRRG